MSNMSAPADKRVVQLDILRGIAILLVMGRHAAAPATESGFFQPLAGFWYRFGWSGVDLFFVLSGFLVGGLLMRELAATSRLDVKRFIIRRGFKIWPGYYALIAFCAVVAAAVQGALHMMPTLPERIPPLGALIRSHPEYVNLDGLLPNLLHVQNYGPLMRDHTWSLAVEEHFYLFLPLALLALTRRAADPIRTLRVIPWIALALILGCTTIRCIPALELNLGRWPSLYQSHLRIDGLFFGVFLAYLYHLRPERLAPLLRRPAMLLVGGILLISPMFVLEKASWFVPRFGLTLMYLGYGALLLFMMSLPVESGRVRAALASWPARALAFIGFYSYSIYLWHVDLGRIPASLLGGLLRPLPNSLTWPVVMGLYVTLAVAAGVLLGRLIEIPALRLRDRLFPRRVEGLAVSTAQPGAAVVTERDADSVPTDRAHAPLPEKSSA